MYLFITNTNQHLLSKHKSYYVIKVQKEQISALIRCALKLFFKPEYSYKIDENI